MTNVLIAEHAPTTEGEKVHISLYLDSEIVAYFKKIAGDAYFRPIINEALKSVIKTAEEQRLAAIEAAYGKYAFVLTSSDDFARRKQEEIDLEG